MQNKSLRRFFARPAFLRLGCGAFRGPPLPHGLGQPSAPFSGHAGYTTIGAAVAAASSGDVIQICPALYAEQIVVNKPLTLRGISQNGVNRVLIQPALPVQPTVPQLGTLPFIAVISIVGTADVTIDNLVVDAGKNAVSGCALPLAGIHFFNASGTVANSVVTGTALNTPTSCAVLFPGNGFGVEADQTAGAVGPFNITVRKSSIHNFGRNGILVNGAAEAAELTGNVIQGIGRLQVPTSSGFFWRMAPRVRS